MEVTTEQVVDLLFDTCLFEDLENYFVSTSDLNNTLRNVLGGGYIPVISDNVYKDVAQWWAKSDWDENICAYVIQAFDDNISIRSHFIRLVERELVSNPEGDVVRVFKHKIVGASLWLRETISHHALLPLSASYEDNRGMFEHFVNMLGLIDTRLHEHGYQFKREAAAVAGKVLAVNLDGYRLRGEMYNPFNFERIAEEDLATFSFCVIEVSKLRPGNLEGVRELCEIAGPCLTDMAVSYKYDSYRIIREILLNYDTSTTLHKMCRGEVELAICIINEAYDSDVFKWASSRTGAERDRMVNNLDYLMRSV